MREEYVFRWASNLAIEITLKINQRKKSDKRRSTCNVKTKGNQAKNPKAHSTESPAISGPLVANATFKITSNTTPSTLTPSRKTHRALRALIFKKLIVRIKCRAA